MIFVEKDIKFTRGDNFNFAFVRKNENNEPITEIVTNAFFTVKKNYDYQDFIIQKRLDNNSISFDNTTGYYHIMIAPEDTNNLVCGKYVYDIEIIRENNVYTAVKGNFILEKEVTYASNEV